MKPTRRYSFVPQADGTLQVAGGTEVYVLTRDGRGGWTCSCPAFRFSRRQPASCKHQRAFERQQAVAFSSASLDRYPDDAPSADPPPAEAQPDAPAADPLLDAITSQTADCLGRCDDQLARAERSVSDATAAPVMAKYAAAVRRLRNGKVEADDPA